MNRARRLERNERLIKVSLYRNNSFPYMLALVSIFFELIYAIKILDVITVNYLMGISTFINIILLFLLFTCAVKINVYKIFWSYLVLVVAIYAVLRAFLIVPLIMRPNALREVLFTCNILLAFFLFVSGTRSLSVIRKRTSYMKTEEAQRLLTMKEQ